MLPCFNNKIQEVEHIIKHAPCKEYDTVDRLGILQYRLYNHKDTLRNLVTLAIQTHLLACQQPLTRLKHPIVVFNPDSLKNIHFIDTLDLKVSLKTKLGHQINTYQELVSWYLSL